MSLCYIPEQIEITSIDQKLYMQLSNEGCPEDMTNKPKCFGACPVRLTFDFEPNRRPDLIVHANCDDTKFQRCSEYAPSECTEDKKKIKVSYPKSETQGYISVSVGCYCTSRPSRLVRPKQPPYPP
jgi:hypothetical protein